MPTTRMRKISEFMGVGWSWPVSVAGSVYVTYFKNGSNTGVNLTKTQRETPALKPHSDSGGAYQELNPDAREGGGGK